MSVTDERTDKEILVSNIGYKQMYTLLELFISAQMEKNAKKERTKRNKKGSYKKLLNTILDSFDFFQGYPIILPIRLTFI